MPPDIGRFGDLKYLNLAGNNLSGPIPSTFGNFSSMFLLELQSNNFNGEIPSTLCNMSSLFILHLSKNKLGGRVPECMGNFSLSLQVLNLKENSLNGLIPSTFTKGNNLLFLSLNDNELEGPVPEALLNCGKLQVLDISFNQIEDSFPYWMGNLSQLRVLVMKSNKLRGEILPSPNELLLFPKLQVFDISSNRFTGLLPIQYLQNFANVMINRTDKGKWFSAYKEPVTLILKNSEHRVERIIVSFAMIDMSENEFDGSIPLSIGELKSVIYLNMSGNRLTGCIPTSIGSLLALEALDLSSNQLVGEIPSQLTRLTFLSVLNLSYNNLDGPIPRVGQFNTFENNSYIGTGLCGFPLTHKCEDEKGPPFILQRKDDDSEFINGFTWRAVAIGYGCGFVLGVVIGFLKFLCQLATVRVA